MLFVLPPYVEQDAPEAEGEEGEGHAEGDDGDLRRLRLAVGVVLHHSRVSVVRAPVLLAGVKVVGVEGSFLVANAAGVSVQSCGAADVVIAQSWTNFSDILGAQSRKYVAIVLAEVHWALPRPPELVPVDGKGRREF